jgi:hypothetical protein
VNPLNKLGTALYTARINLQAFEMVSFTFKHGGHPFPLSVETKQLSKPFSQKELLKQRTRTRQSRPKTAIFGSR